MVGSPNGVEPNISRGLIPTIICQIENLFNVLAAITIFAVMLLTTAGVFFRLIGAPLPASLEISELAIAVFAFMGAAYAQRQAAHIRLELIISNLPGRFRWMLEMLGSFFAFCLMLVLVVYSWEFFLNAWIIGDSTYDYEIPTWPAKLLVPVAFTLWAIRLLIEVVGFARLIVMPNAMPYNVPLTLTPEQEARLEILHSGAGDDANLAAGKE